MDGLCLIFILLILLDTINNQFVGIRERWGERVPGGTRLHHRIEHSKETERLDRPGSLLFTNIPIIQKMQLRDFEVLKQAYFCSMALTRISLIIQFLLQLLAAGMKNMRNTWNIFLVKKMIRI